MFRHILPNALTPVVSFAPFTIVANIGSLVALDFLGFGLPAPTPSWGELIGQGMENLTKWWLVFYPLGVLFVTLLLVVFIGEAVREAFDPKEYSRLRSMDATCRRDGGPARTASRHSRPAHLLLTRSPASPRPSTASISTSGRAKCSASSASPARARASPR